MANIAQMVNVLQAMILTDGPSMVLTPTYHVFDMYQPWQGATALPVEVASPMYEKDDVSIPAISVSAVRAADGQVHLALVNVDPNNAHPVTVGLDGVNPRHRQRPDPDRSRHGRAQQLRAAGGGDAKRLQRREGVARNGNGHAARQVRRRADFALRKRVPGAETAAPGITR